jgi:hypothetical protein
MLFFYRGAEKLKIKISHDTLLVDFTNQQLDRRYIIPKIKGQFFWPFGQPLNLEEVLAAFNPIYNYNIVLLRLISSPKQYFFIKSSKKLICSHF